MKASSANGEKPKSAVKTKWEGLPATTRRKITMFAAIGAVLILAYVVVSGDIGGGRKNNAQGRIENALLVDGSRDLAAAGVANDIKEVTRRLREMEGDNARLRQMMDRYQNDPSKGGVSTDARLNAEVSELRRQVSDLMKNGAANGRQPGTPAPVATTPQRPGRPAPGSDFTPSNPTMESTPSVPGQEPMTPITPPAYGGIRTIKAEAPPAPPPVTSTKKEDVPQFYLPTGSMITGVLLAGVDAPTGKSAMKDPIPVLARVKHDAILPNRYKADVKECFALLEATGDLASERAMMRLTNLSCVRRDRSVIDVPIAGYAVGEDGRAGMRGRLVSKQGQVLAKAMMAGFAEGLSQAFGGGRQNMGLAGDIDYGAVPERGFAGGASSALDRVAAYYLSLADQLHPTVEIDSGRVVTLVLLKGRKVASLAAADDTRQPGNGARK